MKILFYIYTPKLKNIKYIIYYIQNLDTPKFLFHHLYTYMYIYVYVYIYIDASDSVWYARLSLSCT